MGDRPHRTGSLRSVPRGSECWDAPKLGSKANPPLKNVSYLLMKFFGTVLFGLFLWALSLCNAYKNIKKERDGAREHSTKRAFENCDLHNKLRDTENQLYYANERLQASEKDMDDERREFRNTIQDLNDQHLADQEEIRSLKQHVSNTECDRDEYRRRLGYATRDYRKLARENQTLVHENEKLERVNQQLAGSLAEKDDTINELQARTNDLNAERVTAVSSAPIYITPNDGELAKRNERINSLEQQNRTLTSETEVLRTALENLREEHGECSGHLQAQLAEKDEEMRGLRAEKKTADDVSAVAVAGLRADLQKKEQEVEGANRALVANQASSADNLETLRGELQASQHAHAQCDENSASRNSRIGELVTAKDQLEDTLRVKSDEIASLQGRVADLDNDREELQKTHANAQALEITQFRNANGALQESNDNLSQQLEKARDEREALVREGQRVEEQNRTLHDLRTCSQSQTHSLQSRIESLSQTVDDQQQRIHTLETNCPKCQELREALGAFVKDAEMSDDKSRAELRREVAQELISQVPDHLRRQVRGEVAHQLRQEFQSHYSDLLARNTKRIQEQDLLITEKNAKLEKANNNSTVNHAACERKEDYLHSSITKLKQDTKTLQGNCARLNNDAMTGREQLSREQTANEDLKRELEMIKADQRRAQNVNPLQGKLVACQRDVEKMKVDRDKARNNCSIYSESLSDLRKKYEALQKERSPLDGDGLMEDGGSDGPLAVRNEQRMTTSAIDKRTIRTLDGEVARLSKELAELKARDNAREQMTGNQRRLARLPTRLPARQPTDRSVLGGRAGKKRGHEESSDGEADDEGGDDRKKVKLHHLQASKA